MEEGAEEYIPDASQQPEAAEEVKPERNYRTLAEQNSDLTAWLTVPGTQLDYPVLYTHRSRNSTCAGPLTAATPSAAACSSGRAPPRIPNM